MLDLPTKSALVWHIAKGAIAPDPYDPPFLGAEYGVMVWAEGKLLLRSVRAANP